MFIICSRKRVNRNTYSLGSGIQYRNSLVTMRDGRIAQKRQTGRTSTGGGSTQTPLWAKQMPSSYLCAICSGQQSLLYFDPTCSVPSRCVPPSDKVRTCVFVGEIVTSRPPCLFVGGKCMGETNKQKEVGLTRAKRGWKHIKRWPPTVEMVFRGPSSVLYADIGESVRKLKCDLYHR